MQQRSKRWQYSIFYPTREATCNKPHCNPCPTPGVGWLMPAYTSLGLLKLPLTNEDPKRRHHSKSPRHQPGRTPASWPANCQPRGRQLGGTASSTQQHRLAPPRFPCPSPPRLACQALPRPASPRLTPACRASAHPARPTPPRLVPPRLAWPRLASPAPPRAALRATPRLAPPHPLSPHHT